MIKSTINDDDRSRLGDGGGAMRSGTIIAAKAGPTGADGAQMLDDLGRMGEIMSTYRFTILDEVELDLLRWIANRYDSAQLLLDCVGEPEHYPWEVEVPEHVAWNVLDATEGDGAELGSTLLPAGAITAKLKPRPRASASSKSCGVHHDKRAEEDQRPAGC